MHVPFLWTVIVRTRRPSSQSISHLLFLLCFIFLVMSVLLEHIAQERMLWSDFILFFRATPLKPPLTPLQSPFNPLETRLTLPTLLRCIMRRKLLLSPSILLFLFIPHSLSSRALHGHNIRTLTSMIIAGVSSWKHACQFIREKVTTPFYYFLLNFISRNFI